MSLAVLRQHQGYLDSSLHITQSLINWLNIQLADIECSLSKIAPTRKEKKRLSHARWKTNKTLKTCRNEEQMLLEAIKICQGRIQAYETEWMYLDAAQHATAAWPWNWDQPKACTAWPDWQWSPVLPWANQSAVSFNMGYSGPYLHSPYHLDWTSPDYIQTRITMTPRFSLSSTDIQTHDWPTTLTTTPWDTYALSSPSSTPSVSSSTMQSQDHNRALTLPTIAEDTQTSDRRDSVLRADASPFKPTTPTIIAHRRLLSYDEPISPRTVAPPRSPSVNEKRSECKYSAAAVDLLEYRFSHSPKRSRCHSRQRSNAATPLRYVEEVDGQGGVLWVGS